MSDPFDEVKNHFNTVEGVTVNSGKGAQGLKLGKKMFVMFFKGQLIVMLPPERISELIESGEVHRQQQRLPPSTPANTPSRTPVSNDLTAIDRSQSARACA